MALPAVPEGAIFHWNCPSAALILCSKAYPVVIYVLLLEASMYEFDETKYVSELDIIEPTPPTCIALNALPHALGVTPNPRLPEASKRIL